MGEATTTDSVFHKKYDEFCEDLLGACPEYSQDIRLAKALDRQVRETKYVENILRQGRSATQNPGVVLPGVILSDDVWTALSDGSRKAIVAYLQILDVSIICEVDMSGAKVGRDWMDGILKEWRSKMSRGDFTNLTDKFATMFGENSANLPPLPERFLKGKLAKLAEDMVSEFRPEDFGLKPEDIAACEKDPTRAFEILLEAASDNPQKLQQVMVRVAKKLQTKMQTGAFKPQDLAKEAEELMKEFQGHPAFTEMLKQFRDSFSFAEPETARRAGRDGENRLELARERLRKKLAERKK